MATKKVCDICGEAAESSFEFKMDGTTPIIKDVCPKHFEHLKNFFQKFLKNDNAE